MLQRTRHRGMAGLRQCAGALGTSALDAANCALRRPPAPRRLQYLPGIIATLALIMINSVRR